MLNPLNKTQDMPLNSFQINLEYAFEIISNTLKYAFVHCTVPETVTSPISSSGEA